MKATAKLFDFSTPLVMGILNVTPDSFYDGARYRLHTAGLQRAEQMISEGAAIIDIGGVSTRPGSNEVGPAEEWNRIYQTLTSVRKEFPKICISVDTYHAGVAEKALAEGADMINDISGGTFDTGMPSLIGKNNTPYVLMHIKGRPGNMQNNPHYKDVTTEVMDYFKKQIKLFNASGANNLILDPGFGFGKTMEHNYTLLNELDQFLDLGYPILTGMSRKSMISRLLDIKADDALNGTTALNTIALLKGASILRVHDVKEAREAIRIVGMVKQ